MSIEASLSKLNDIEVTRQGSLRTSIKIGDIRASQISVLKKSQRLTHSRKTMIKNGSSQTFQTEPPVKSFEKIFDESQIYGFQTGFCLSRNSNQRWSTQKYSRSQNSRQFQPQTLKKHQKTLSINHRTPSRQSSVKTEPSLEHPFVPISLQSYIKQVKFNKLSLSKSIQIPKTSVTINQLMMSKFSSRRKYENSKIVRRDMLPKFLKFSISKCQLHEKIMNNTISSNLFKKHEVSYERKSIKL